MVGGIKQKLMTVVILKCKNQISSGSDGKEWKWKIRKTGKV